MSELFEVFDAQNQPLGYTKERRLVHEEGDWHRTAQVYVLNEQHELLCNLRHPAKDVFPALWDVCIGGHLAPDETYQSGAVRELEEELGVTVHPNELQFIGLVSIDGKDAVKKLFDREHAGIFVWRTHLKAEDFSYQEEEITQLRFFPLEVVKHNLSAENPHIIFIPLWETYLNIIASVEKSTAS